MCFHWKQAQEGTAYVQVNILVLPLVSRLHFSTFFMKILLWMYIMLLSVSFSICSIKVILSTGTHTHGCKCIPPSQSIEAHSALQTSRSSRAWRTPRGISLLWLRWLSTSDIFVQRLGGGAACCSVFSSMLYRIPYTKYMVNPSR